MLTNLPEVLPHSNGEAFRAEMLLITSLLIAVAKTPGKMSKIIRVCRNYIFVKLSHCVRCMLKYINLCEVNIYCGITSYYLEKNMFSCYFYHEEIGINKLYYFRHAV